MRTRRALLRLSLAAACLMAIGHNDEALAELENASRLDPAQNLYRARKEELLKVMAQPSRP